MKSYDLGPLLLHLLASIAVHLPTLQREERVSQSEGIAAVSAEVGKERESQ